MQRTVLRSSALALAAAISLAAGACGGSDDGDPTTAAETKPTTFETTPRESPATGDRGDAKRGSDKGAAWKSKARAAPEDPGEQGAGSDGERVATVVEGMYRDIAAANAAGVCAVMSRAARDQIAQQTIDGGAGDPGERTCEASLGRFLSAASTSGMLERTQNVMVRSVEIDGDNATATVSFGGTPGQIQLISEDGDWRFGAEAVTPPAARK